MSFPVTTLQLLCRESCGALCPHIPVRAMVCSPLLSCCGDISYLLLHPSQKTSFPHPMPSVFLAIIGLCRLYYEIDIKGELSLGLCRVGAIPCILMSCILPYGLELCL